MNDNYTTALHFGSNLWHFTQTQISLSDKSMILQPPKAVCLLRNGVSDNSIMLQTPQSSVSSVLPDPSPVPHPSCPRDSGCLGTDCSGPAVPVVCLHPQCHPSPVALPGQDEGSGGWAGSSCPWLSLSSDPHKFPFPWSQEKPESPVLSLCPASLGVQWSLLWGHRSLGLLTAPTPLADSICLFLLGFSWVLQWTEWSVLLSELVLRTAITSYSCPSGHPRALRESLL